ncbi:hypothetical protein HY488_02695 [Candidatus Woesearchaeota archaeon]|nr:hypothetical protein [Candidatus Woesearchaeota archaeon]
MARKFGYNLSNKRNREIFGPTWGQIIIAIAVILVLVIALIMLISEEEEEVTEETEAVPETLEEAAPVKTTTPQKQPLPAEQASEEVLGECPLPSIPIVEFTEENLYGDVSQDETLPNACKADVEASKRRLAKLYSNAINDEDTVLQAEQQLANEIKNLEATLDKLYAERDYLEQARSCTAENALADNLYSEEITEETPPEEIAAEEETAADETQN